MDKLPNDAIASLLVFLIGVPALIYQLAPPEVREVIIQKELRYRLKYIIPSCVGIFTVLAVYFYCIRAKEDYYKYIWDYEIGFLLFLTLYTVIWVFPIISKKQLINKLVSNTLRKYRRGGEYPDKDLRNLALLGKESKGGEERSWTIAALGRLTNHVLESKEYTGSQLEEVIHTLDAVLFEGIQPSTPDNYRDAISIVRKVVEQYYQRIKSEPEFCDADLCHVWWSLRLWAQKTLELAEHGITEDCLNILDSRGLRPSPAISEALREIGISAVQKGQLQTALDAAMKIHSIYPSDNDLEIAENAVPDEVIYDQFALMAYIWCHGPSGKDWITQYLHELEHDSGVNLCEAIKRTIQHHRDTAHFEIADSVKEMYEQWQLKSAEGI